MGVYYELDYKAIGKRIRMIRKAKNITQEKLSEKVNISKTHMNHIESGSTKLSVATLINISNALGVTTDRLLCDCVGASIPILKKEIEEIIWDCTANELSCIINVMNEVKNGIRQYLIHQGEKDE